jgi:hypothetical protein
MWRSDGIEALPPRAMMSGLGVSEMVFPKSGISLMLAILSRRLPRICPKNFSTKPQPNHISLVRGQNVDLDQRPFCGVLVTRDGAKARGGGITTTRLRASVVLRVISISFGFNL